VYDGVVLGGFSDNDSPVKIVGQVGVGFIPVVGQIADGRDTVAALHKVVTGKPDGWSSLGFALLGWIPFGGDLLKTFRRGSAQK
jgi:hypothetical protein